MKRTPLSGLIILELAHGPATLDEIQSAVTVARINEGLKRSVVKLILRYPVTILRLFRPVPVSRLKQSLDMLISNHRVQYYPQQDMYALTEGEGARSVEHWKSRLSSGAYQ